MAEVKKAMSQVQTTMKEGVVGKHYNYLDPTCVCLAGNYEP